MKILVACEESQRVCIAFRKRGFEAYSCDIQDCSGGHPEWHIKGDVTPLLHEKWDLIIAHPPCTFLTVSGNRWFNVNKYGEKALKRIDERKKAIEFFMMFVNADCKHIAIENPIGIISTIYRKPDQIIQPWNFGDNFVKSTCLWLKNLPCLELKYTEKPNIEYYTWIDKKTGKFKRQDLFYKNCWNLPKDLRALERSKTFPGIAEAMAEQWGNYLKEE